VSAKILFAFVENKGWVASAAEAFGLDTDDWLDDWFVCDDLDVEDLCLSGLVEVVDLMDFFQKVLFQSRCQFVYFWKQFFVATAAYVSWVLGITRLRASLKVRLWCICDVFLFLARKQDIF